MSNTTRRFVTGFALGALTLLLGCASARAEDWPQWRGPRGDGTSSETGIPIQWGPRENIIWQTPIPGKGHSSPVICGERIFVTTCLEKDGKHVLLSLDRQTGKVLWEQAVDFKMQKPIHAVNSHASSTPATDGKYVFVTFHDQPHFVVCCYGYDGKILWRKSPGRFHSLHGFCSSPVLYKDLVILNGDQEAEGYLVALDKATGEEKWRVQRTGVRMGSFCPPVVFAIDGKNQVVIGGAKITAGYDADSGKQLWVVDGPADQVVASLVRNGDVLFMSYCYPKRGIMGIKAGGSGNVTQTHVLYNDSPGAGGNAPSPVAHGDWFFTVSDEGIASCREARTGKLVWKERLGRQHIASPVAAGACLYFPDTNGITWVLRAGPEFEVVQKNSIGEGVHASLAIARGKIILRGSKAMYCLGTADGQAYGGR